MFCILCDGQSAVAMREGSRKQRTGSRTGSRKQSLVYSQVLERGSLNALKGRGDAPDFGQVAEDRSEGKSRQEPLLGSAGEARQRRVGSVGFAS